MTDDVLIRRTEGSAAAEPSHGAEWNARPTAAPLNAMGANVTIQKNWQELIRPNKLQVTPGVDPKREATLIAEPLERGFGVTLGNALRRVLLSSLQGAADRHRAQHQGHRHQDAGRWAQAHGGEEAGTGRGHRR
jgi:hypothetical protein